MAHLLKFLKLTILLEAKPVKNISYIQSIFESIENITKAKASNDWLTLFQYRFVGFFSLRLSLLPLIRHIGCFSYYRFVYVLLLVRSAQLIYLGHANLSELDTLINFDPFSWLEIDKNAYLVCSLYLLLSCYFFHIIYFSKNDYFPKTRSLIYFKPETVNYHWPYRYKQHDSCGHLVRFFILNVLKALQFFVVIFGNSY